jgi:hypothetical protein
MAIDEMRIGALRAPERYDEIAIGGLGARRKRVEDARFIRGKGNYLDDFKLPRMLHMEILRSPVAHARIRSIDTSRAWMTPGVHLVVTGEMAAQHNLAWMPTLSYDTQAVLATDKVRFQGQEVACVIADDPYVAKQGCLRSHRDRLRSSAGDCEPEAGRRPWRPRHPGRQGEPGERALRGAPSGQRVLSLGGRRQGGDGPGL